VRHREAQRTGWSVVFAAWLAVFCLFGYRATFAILKGPIAITMEWRAAQVTLGYSLMMVCYAITAYGSGLMLDRWGARPAYAVAAVLGGLGFFLTSRVSDHLAYLVTFGLLGGVATGMLWVSSTVSVRQWYVGRTYATMWGLAFAGAPMAQFTLAQWVKPRLGQAQQALDQALVAAAGLDVAVLAPSELAQAASAALADPAVRTSALVAPALRGLDAAWRGEMRMLGVIVFVALIAAALAARKPPEHYGMRPFGALPTAAGDRSPPEQDWQVGAAFARYAIWGAILTFLTSMMAEFLIWTQVISYWTDDVGYSLQEATGIYAVIGLIGVFSMPIMGRVADAVVKAVGQEARGRRVMLLIGPFTGGVACLVLLQSHRLTLAYAACVIFAIYWAILPGGVVGYAGAVYGRRALGKIWGLATLIVMGIGPFAGSLIGGLLKDISGRYTHSIYYALGSFAVSILLAASLPTTAGPAQAGRG